MTRINEPKLREFMETFPFEIRLVGGAVRDLVDGKKLEEVKDLDFSIPFSPEHFLNILQVINHPVRKLKNTSKLGTLEFEHPEFGKIEFVSRRTEIYKENDRKPHIRYNATLLSDLERRDFTMNAMSMNKYGTIYDPFGGIQDMERNKIVLIGSQERWSEDPLRILRAIRFAAKFGMEIENDYWDEGKVLTLSKQRIVQEFDKMFIESGDRALDILQMYGIIKYVMPEVNGDVIYSFKKKRLHHEGVEAFWGALFVAALDEVSTDLSSDMLCITDFITKQGNHLNWSKERIAKTIDLGSRNFR